MAESEMLVATYVPDEVEATQPEEMLLSNKGDSICLFYVISVGNTLLILLPANFRTVISCLLNKDTTGTNKLYSIYHMA